MSGNDIEDPHGDLDDTNLSDEDIETLEMTLAELKKANATKRKLLQRIAQQRTSVLLGLNNSPPSDTGGVVNESSSSSGLQTTGGPGGATSRVNNGVTQGKSMAGAVKSGMERAPDLRNNWKRSEPIKALGKVVGFYKSGYKNHNVANLADWVLKRDEEIIATINLVIAQCLNSEIGIEKVHDLLDKKRPGQLIPRSPLAELEAKHNADRQMAKKEKTIAELRLSGISETEYKKNVADYRNIEKQKATDYLNKFIADDDLKIKPEEIKVTKRLRNRESAKGVHTRKETDENKDVMTVLFHDKTRAWFAEGEYRKSFQAEKAKAIEEKSPELPRRAIQRSMTPKQRKAQSEAYEKINRKNKKLMADKFVEDTKDLEKIWIVRYINGDPIPDLVINRKWSMYVDPEEFQRNKTEILIEREEWRKNDKARIEKLKAEKKKSAAATKQGASAAATEASATGDDKQTAGASNEN